jgi:hypothetical protein
MWRPVERVPLLVLRYAGGMSTNNNSMIKIDPVNRVMKISSETEDGVMNDLSSL